MLVLIDNLLPADNTRDTFTEMTIRLEALVSRFSADQNESEQVSTLLKKILKCNII